MIKTKKSYAAPKVTRVSLVVKNAVLGTCHSSPVMTPKIIGIGGCNIVVDECWFGPGN